MTYWSGLERFLSTDPLDAGCAQTMELLDVYVELMLADAEAESRFPGIAAHLRDCNPCADDFAGLLAAAGG
jgi:hypothetical protein